MTTYDHMISTERETDDGTVKCLHCGEPGRDYCCAACDERLREQYPPPDDPPSGSPYLDRFVHAVLRRAEENQQ